MTEETSKCETSINSMARLNVSIRDLVSLHDRLNYLASSLRSLQEDQQSMQKSIVETARELEMAEQLFGSLFSEQISAVADREEVSSELCAERREAARTPEQITLAMSEVTREQILSLMDAIKRVKAESQGAAPKEIVKSRARSIGIKEEDFEDILSRLRRAGALVESEGTLRLV